MLDDVQRVRLMLDDVQRVRLMLDTAGLPHGQGITTMVVLQSMSQARARWGSDETAALWDGCTVADATLAQLVYGVYPMALGWLCAGAAGAIAVAACELRSTAPAKRSHNTLRMEEL
jgi:TraM recognition site of TraD and TraG